ncbi:MAG: hypothetical protein N2560_10345, partial [Ignavibacteria bacterium]|nr:hypothetical protein [Ignavibacteria bacterium]
MKAKLIIYFIFWIFFIYSCTENVNVSVPTQDTTSANFALILCEGLWGYNNSSVSKLNLFTYDVINDFTFFANPNFKIGDTGNDIALKGDTFFVVVTTSKVLEIFNSKTGKLIDYITFQEGSAPRHIAIINDTLVAVTDLFKDCVYLVNIVSKNIVNTILVGPAPEFVEFYDGKLFVVNSGYGDYRAKEPKAGTLSVVDIKLGKEIQNVFIAPNPIEVLIDRLRKRLFVSYNHLPSLKDSIGG